MKKFLLITLLIYVSVSNLHSQDWQNICAPGVTFFKDYAGNLHGYRFDSLKTIASDTVFYSHLTIIRNNDPWACSDTCCGPVLTKVIRKKSNGWFTFVDRNTDSVQFNAMAGLNQTWNCRPLPFSRYLEAKVTAIRQEGFLDTTDLVKEITFNARNQDGTLYPHIINGTNLLLSQHFGFITTIDFNLFPNDTVHYFIAGKQSPAIGLQELTAREIYSMDVSDVFHSVNSVSSSGGGPSDKVIETILQKTEYGDDSIVYLIERCREETLPQPPPNVNYYWDTVSRKYNLNNPNLYRLLNEFHREGYQATRYYRSSESFNNRPMKGYSRLDYHVGYGNCWKETHFEETFHDESNYAKGLGQVWYFRSDGDPYLYVIIWQGWLTYYKKGAETWGTPLASDCHTLVGIKKNGTVDNIKIIISPNPISDEAKITVTGMATGQKMCYEVRNLYGQNVCTGNFSGNSFVFHRGKLPIGIYLLVINDQADKILIKTKILLN